MTRAPASTLVRAAAKTLLGLGVFATTIAAWSHLRPVVESHHPLPGLERANSACTIWFVGSSSINRWATLARDLAPWDARNRGVDGASIRDVRERFAADDGVDAIAGIVFYIGENDIANGATPADTARNLFAMVDAARARRPRVPIFVVSMKPSPTRWALWPQLQALNARLAAGAEANRVTLIRSGEVLLVNGHPGPYYAPDGVHLSPAGYRLWGGAIRRGLEAGLPGATKARCLRARA